MFTARIARLIAGKAGYPGELHRRLRAVVVSGYAHKAVGELNALGQGITIGGGSSVGAMNILVMGLESRTNATACPTPTWIARTASRRSSTT